jgi:Fe-S oxidoreductase
MMISDKAKKHVDSCRFCWMCHHICPIGNATGHERSTPRARALGISMVARDAIALEEIMENIYECAGCGGCVHDWLQHQAQTLRVERPHLCPQRKA